MNRSFVLRSCVLAAALCALAACSSVGGPPRETASYKILSSFKPRAGQDDVGVRVESHLAEGSLSDAQLKQLSAFIATFLDRSGRFGAVLDLTSGAGRASGQVLLAIHVTKFQVASKDEVKAGGASHLDGTIYVTGMNETELGSGMIWASGYRLELLGQTEPPDTVREFAATIVELMQ